MDGRLTMDKIKQELKTAFDTALEISVKREDVDRMMQVRQALQRAFSLTAEAEKRLAAVTKERDTYLAELSKGLEGVKNDGR